MKKQFCEVIHNYKEKRLRCSILKLEIILVIERNIKILQHSVPSSLTEKALVADETRWKYMALDEVVPKSHSILWGNLYELYALKRPFSCSTILEVWNSTTILWILSHSKNSKKLLELARVLLKVGLIERPTVEYIIGSSIFQAY